MFQFCITWKNNIQGISCENLREIGLDVAIFGTKIWTSRIKWEKTIHC